MGHAAAPIKLKIALGSAPHTLPIKRGDISIAGVDPEFVEVTPIIGAFRRMVRDLEFDVCEMAPTTYMIARAAGAPFVALPTFLSRQFHFDAIVCRAPLASPRELEGQRVGVRAYSVTTGVWARGMLASEYGLDISKVTWVVDDEEAVSNLVLPENVTRAPVGKSLASMFAEGELAAAFTGPAGIGRQGPPTSGWDKERPLPTAPAYPLFEQPAQLAASWLRRSGIYPFHGLVVVKDSVLAEAPWVARALFDALSAAKRPLIEVLQSKAAQPSEIERYRTLAALVGGDPLPYGVEANRTSIEALIGYADAQGLLSKRLSVEDLFVALEET